VRKYSRDPGAATTGGPAGEYLARKLPRARFELVAGFGHWMHDQIPAALEWLAGGD